MPGSSRPVPKLTFALLSGPLMALTDSAAFGMPCRSGAKLVPPSDVPSLPFPLLSDRLPFISHSPTGAGKAAHSSHRDRLSRTWTA